MHTFVNAPNKEQYLKTHRNTWNVSKFLFDKHNNIALYETGFQVQTRYVVQHTDVGFNFDLCNYRTLGEYM